MSRSNPFGDLDGFAAKPTTKPVPTAAIEEITQASGFPSRKAQTTKQADQVKPSPMPQEDASIPSPSKPLRTPRRHTTGRNRQINIKATEETIKLLYRIADDMGLPLGAVLEQALTALEQQKS